MLYNNTEIIIVNSELCIYTSSSSSTYLLYIFVFTLLTCTYSTQQHAGRQASSLQLTSSAIAMQEVYTVYTVCMY